MKSKIKVMPKIDRDFNNAKMYFWSKFGNSSFNSWVVAAWTNSKWGKCWFYVKFDLEVQSQSPHKTRRISSKVFYTSGPNLVILVQQPSWPASLSTTGLTLWSNWLERWFATLSILSTQVWIPAGLLVLGRYIGSSSQGLGEAQHIDRSFRANWLSCFWPDVNSGSPDRGVWCHWGREKYDNQAGLLASRRRVWPFGRIC